MVVSGEMATAPKITVVVLIGLTLVYGVVNPIDTSVHLFNDGVNASGVNVYSKTLETY